VLGDVRLRETVPECRGRRLVAHLMEEQRLLRGARDRF
jgi:hypothetical protein